MDGKRSPGSSPPRAARARASAFAALLLAAACRSPAEHREEADGTAYRIVEQARAGALGRTEPFTIETPAESLRRRLLLDQDLPRSDDASLGSRDVPRIEQWPDDGYFEPRAEADLPAPDWSTHATLRLRLLDALLIGARNSREYQTQKELVFQAALALDLERDRFRQTWVGLLDAGLTRDLGASSPTTAASGGGDLGVTQRLLNGASITVNLAVDVLKLLTQGHDSLFGALADATIAVPLLRGSGKFVVREPLLQAERAVVYAIYAFERFKRVFAVQVASEYYSVLQLLQEVDNELENYRWLVAATRRARRLAEAQRDVDQVEVDQTEQDELEARDAWVQSIRAYEARLDGLKGLLGLPVDARIELERSELDALAAVTAFEAPRPEPERVPASAPVEVVLPTRAGGGPLEIAPEDAVLLALGNRLDLRVALGRVFDAQRSVAVAADALRADLTLLGRASGGYERAGTGPAASVRERPESHSVLGLVDFGLERTAERNLYRESQIGFERDVRAAQALEDQVKLEVREDLRALLEARERLKIQAQSVELAERRVNVASRFLEVGRADARDVLEAQRDLVDAKNALSLERVRYRVAELALQRDLELLEVDERGLWTEVDPAALDPER
jgi:hypothetical protein